MSVTEKLMAPGQFSVQLDKTTIPNTIINQLDAWGNIVIVPADLNVLDWANVESGNPYIVNDLPANGRRLMQGTTGS